MINSEVHTWHSRRQLPELVEQSAQLIDLWNKINLRQDLLISRDDELAWDENFMDDLYQIINVFAAHIEMDVHASRRLIQYNNTHQDNVWDNIGR
ncbi:hypothetical protein ROZALSC1DRAFT_30083 [Rozella allomycis CSF55]|uniref:Uncharacterized protein n=1 Tax=Rozella allomycis (strain CSF55) TaxID=988480 RepID=A0A4P9YGR4_ROZAC|nr:hypothetical protein ROZALSC1DRAFT_30083 [Rozella allomycis CSF55]